jgi:hypothetical protein
MEMARNHVRHDAFEVLRRLPAEDAEAASLREVSAA